MQGLVCKYCGGTEFNETDHGYECMHCHAVYELDRVSEVKRTQQTEKKFPKFYFYMGIIILIVLGSIFFELNNSPKRLLTKGDLENKQSTVSSSSDYSVSQLKNLERNVIVAELSLNQEALSLAKASIKEFGGKQTEEYEERLKSAQKEHDKMKKIRAKKPLKSDMLVENPDSDMAVTTYYRENGFFVAYGSEYDQYSDKDIIQIWGEPDEIITDPNKISDSLSIKYDDENNPANYETKVLKDQWLNGQITFREVRAFQAYVVDNSYAGYTKEFVYQNQGKPNVYFNDNQVGYVTPIVRYVSFLRLPEKYPYLGLGKYPDDYPENYGSKGFYDEK